jgi:endonuclease YncB( thermonuclease family)
VTFPREGLSGLRFGLPPGRTRQFCVGTTVGERSLLRARPDGDRAADRPVPLDVVLSSDPAGDSEMSRASMTLDVLAPERLRVGRRQLDPSLVIRSDCSAGLRHELAIQQSRPATATPVEVLDAVTLITRTTSAGPQVVRLLGIRACRKRQAADQLKRVVLGGGAHRLRLEPDTGEGARDRDGTSRLLRHVEVVGAPRTVQEELLRSGWVTTQLTDRVSPERAADLRRAARVGQRVRRKLHESC